MIKKPYPPGKTTQKRRRRLSEYGVEFAEKQKLKNWYNLSEHQFYQYVSKALSERKKAEETPLELLNLLERRFDNVVFRLGFAASKKEARQLVSHGFFFVNGKKVNIPSFQLKKGDVVSLAASKAKKEKTKVFSLRLKKAQPPAWLKLLKEKMEGKVLRDLNLSDLSFPAEISSIFEFYSR